MKPIFLILFAIFSATTAVAQDTHTLQLDKSTFQWPDNQRGAVSLSYDDGVSCHFQHVAPALEAVGLRATFYVPITFYNANIINNTEKWQRLADVGHELGNHSIFHPCRGAGQKYMTWLDKGHDLADYSKNRWRDEMKAANFTLQLIDGQTDRTFGNTCNETILGPDDDPIYIEDVIDGLFVAARGKYTKRKLDDERGIYTVDITNINFGNLGCYGADGKSYEELKKVIDYAIQRGDWIIFEIHGVGEECHNLFIDETEHQKLIEYLAANKDTIWTAPVVQIAKYLKSQTP